ncbi:MAG: phosphomannomutase/phosphoglucomutase [Bacteriovoracia bacterium]
MFKSKIFREYDIRGVVGEDYRPEFASLLARAVAEYFRKHRSPGNNRNQYRFAVGRDCRLSGEDLAPRFMTALVNEGFEVVDLGVVATPLVYFSTFTEDLDGAVSITGSHNPAEYNGFKICFGKSTLHGDQIQELRKITESLLGQPHSISINGCADGNSHSIDIISKYQADLQKRVTLGKPVKVVIDAGNGTASNVAPELLRAVGCEVIPLYCELDGRFPNHHPDPTVLENLVDLQKAVLEHKADLGIAYDGDSDRIGAVDEKGRPIFGDELMVLYSREILSRKPGATIIGEVKCSHRMYQDIEKHGGKPVMWKTGHSLIKAKLKEEKAELAGEMSGHMFFADRYYGYDDAIYASLRLIEIVSNSKQPLSTLLADLPRSVSTPEIRVDCADELKFDIVSQVRSDLSKTYKTIDVDGVRIETPIGWGLLRASNTQPVVVMRFEASNDSDLEKLRLTVESAFEKAKHVVK